MTWVRRSELNRLWAIGQGDYSISPARIRWYES